MSYEEAVAYILEIPKFTKKHALAHTKAFLARLGNPEQGKKVIHVAGTNGKGSVCAYMQALLLSEGKQTGFFTSPHLVKLNERIKCNGEDISDSAFTELFERVRRIVKEGEENGDPHPTFFEFLFGMAMVFFADKDVEYIILETGLGGRLDATNAIETPLLTILTSISLDHTEILGNTIAQIAAEKAGIIKENTPVICDANEEVSLQVIRNVCLEKNAPCREITNHAYEMKEIRDKDIAFLSTNAYYEDITWHIKGQASYQIMNALLALQGMEYLAEYTGKHLHKWKKAIESVCWEGRMEEVLQGVIVDGAHNMGAIQAFVSSACQIDGIDTRKKVLLFAAVREKPYEDMIAYLCAKFSPEVIVITELRDSRRVEAEKLASTFKKYTDKKVIVIKDAKEAFYEAVRQKGTEGRVFCLGSLYLVGEIKAIV